MKMVKVALVIVALSATNLYAEEAPNSTKIPSVTYNHFDDAPALFKIDIDPGKYYNVNVVDSCPKYFEVRSEGVPAGRADQPEIKSTVKVKGDTYVPPENISAALPDYMKNSSINCYIDPDTKNKVVRQVSHGDDDGGARIRIEYNERYNTDYAADLTHGVTALRIKKNSLEALNKALKENYDTYKSKIDNVDAEAKRQCDAADCNGVAAGGDKSPLIKQYVAKLRTEYHDDSEKAVKNAIETNTETRKLTPSMFSVATNNSDWGVELAGAFTVSALTDKKYGTEKNDKGENVVVRQKDNEDSAALGFAAFVHITKPELKYWVPVSFGLGINDSNAVSYFVGTGLRFSNKAFLTVGYNWGPTKTLPSGIKEGSVVSDPNDLSSEGTRTGGGVFLAISYSFLSTNSGSIISKPFLEPTPK